MEKKKEVEELKQEVLQEVVGGSVLTAVRSYQNFKSIYAASTVASSLFSPRLTIPTIQVFLD